MKTHYLNWRSTFLEQSNKDTVIKYLEIFYRTIGQIGARILQLFGIEYKNSFDFDLKDKIYTQGFGVNYTEKNKPLVYELCELRADNREKAHNITYTGVNGANISSTMAKINASYFALILKRPIVFITNPTLGKIQDFYRYVLEAFRLKITPTSLLLNKSWESILDLNPDEQIIHLCHSEGVAITRNALLITPSKLRGRIHVIAISPGCYIDPDLCGRIVHLTSTQDFVPYLDAKGRNRSSHTLNSLTSSKAGFEHRVFNQVYAQEIQLLATAFEENINSI